MNRRSGGTIPAAAPFLARSRCFLEARAPMRPVAEGLRVRKRAAAQSNRIAGLKYVAFPVEQLHLTLDNVGTFIVFHDFDF